MKKPNSFAAHHLGEWIQKVGYRQVVTIIRRAEAWQMHEPGGYNIEDISKFEIEWGDYRLELVKDEHGYPKVEITLLNEDEDV